LGEYGACYPPASDAGKIVIAWFDGSSSKVVDVGDSVIPDSRPIQPVVDAIVDAVAGGLWVR
jgi:hypothetical protein